MNISNYSVLIVKFDRAAILNIGIQAVQTTLHRQAINTMTEIFHYSKDSDNIVTVSMDMQGAVNTLDSVFRDAIESAADRLEAESPLAGVIITSAKQVFLAGADLNEILSVNKGQEQELVDICLRLKNNFRRLEKLPVPVVAAINGAALGGGFELCLSCHYRIAFNHRSVQLGLPEVNFGLLPGGGGIVRLVNLIGFGAALPYLLEGKPAVPTKALATGIIDETVDSLEDLLPKAKKYILENSNNPNAAIQPWDKANFTIPGGNASTAENVTIAEATGQQLLAKTRGLLPAPTKILETASISASDTFDNALVAESNAFAQLATTAEAKNMITTFFFQMKGINDGDSRPKGYEKSKVQQIGIIGAGAMGQGIAFSAASVGIKVILKDMDLASAEKGKAYTQKVLDKQISRQRITEEQKNATLALITPTAEDKDLAGCDLIIEAVFENMDLKHKITKSCEPFLTGNGVMASNTSTLPITMLAEASSKPESYIGMHFFSPVDKMPLVELICGEKTSDETLAKAFDFTRQIKKTPIVVNDSPGFYTSRVIITYLDEGVRLLAEGLNPDRIDKLGQALGLPLGPLAIHDETSQQLTIKIFDAWESLGIASPLNDTSITYGIVTTLINEHGRGGRRHGGGFYEYPEDGKKHIWKELYNLYEDDSADVSDQEIKDRLLFRPVIESLKCLETNVLPTAADGNIGSILGIGAPTWTGGYIQFVNTYGLEEFTTRCNELEQRFGDRFKVPAIVAQKLKAGELF